MIRVVIADDHTMMREGLKRIVEVAADIEVVGEAVNGFAALDHARKGGFDLLVLDLSMPGLSGRELVQRIRHEAPTLPLLLMTMYEDEGDVRQAVLAGANGLLAKEHAGEQFVAAIKQIVSGHAYPTTDVAGSFQSDVKQAREPR
ncbi:DNA-binding response regulator [Noviherbaspirillum cavernae]|uniref:DNA-binding response regulator n=1 Tax=Noviherbaspirillum cavernae TaxID=2320862 RepID=A0A418WZL9_9BURK|nr:response regulator transcription factor [Noviherbaspirillum cavernae]RJG05523.1 DNA-binding response regulator [Noviherbaspirillum cavernae]